MTENMFGPWRKSSRSGNEGNCVEIAWRKSSYSMNEGNCVEIAWRKSSRSGDESNCVELANIGAVRDSKNPAGATLGVDLADLLTAAKAGRLDR
ncbi:DUF397 domain-containing protein [Actinokineospora sp.]|uniref:DUF397 domain-containing protein n=1 Tax=Actinokineospora sp. TaxID=1872133 RepID=UPI004037C49C